MLDCGSTVNISQVSLIVLSSTILRPSRAPLRMFDKTELKTHEMLSAIVRRPRMKAEYELDFYVTPREKHILDIDACRKLDMSRRIFVKCTNLSICRIGRARRRH